VVAFEFVEKLFAGLGVDDLLQDERFAAEGFSRALLSVEAKAIDG